VGNAGTVLQFRIRGTDKTTQRFLSLHPPLAAADETPVCSPTRAEAKMPGSHPLTGVAAHFCAV